MLNVTKEKEKAYGLELFDRLKKSIGLRREEECFSTYINPAAWWLMENPAPTLREVESLILCKCTNYKKPVHGLEINCARTLMGAIRKAAKTGKLVKMNCSDVIHGFVYPIAHGDKIYGYIGSCYERKMMPPQMLDIFSAFTDTIVREVQKEVELSKLYETIRPRAIALSTVHTVHRLISSTLDMNELLPRIARLSLQILRANRCSIKLVDSRKKVLLPKVTVDLREKNTRLKKVKVGKWAPGKAFKYERPFRGERYLATPLIDEDVIGVITVYDKIDNKPFTSFDQEIMSTMAEQAVIAIKNAQLYKEQEKLTMGSIKSLAKVLDTRAPGTLVPRASFLKIALAVGQEMRLGLEGLKSLEYAAILHDAGEIVVPDDVLTKPSKLTGKEYDIIKEHPMMSVEIIKHMKALKSATPIVLYHHENYDGTGYPKGLKKDQIPPGARIMAVVGAFEAMVTKRPYRVVKSIDEAVEEIRKNSGTQFDPEVVRIFNKIIGRRDIRQMMEKELYGHR